MQNEFLYTPVCGLGHKNHVFGGTRYLKRHTEFAELLNNLGSVLQEYRRLDEAIDCYRQAIAIKNDARIWDNLLVALHTHPDYGPQRIYEVLLDAKQFAAFTGMPAEIDAKPGGAFSMFGGQIVGRNVELVANQRIVQAWRPTHWDPGIYSIAAFVFKPTGGGTLVVLDHKGFPEGDFDHLEWGWHNHYWDPLKKFLS